MTFRKGSAHFLRMHPALKGTRQEGEWDNQWPDSGAKVVNSMERGACGIRHAWQKARAQQQQGDFPAAQRRGPGSKLTTGSHAPTRDSEV